MNRRRVLQGLGVIAGAGALGRFTLLPPSRSRTLEPADQLAARFFDSLDAGQRSQSGPQAEERQRLGLGDQGAHAIKHDGIGGGVGPSRHQLQEVLDPAEPRVAG